MHRKFLAICLVVAALVGLPAAAIGHGALNTGVVPWEPAGSGGNHTVGFCLDTSYYGPTTWTPTDPAHARLIEAMASWHAIYGVQALVKAGSGGLYGCPAADKRVIVYAKPGSQYPFADPNGPCDGDANPSAKMCVTQSSQTIECNQTGGEPWGNDCSNDKALWVNDDYLWYVGTGTPTAGSWDLETGLLHEIGHVLGLTHLGNCGQAYLMCTDLFNSNGDAPFYMRTIPSHDSQFIIDFYDPPSHNH